MALLHIPSMEDYYLYIEYYRGAYNAFAGGLAAWITCRVNLILKRGIEKFILDVYIIRLH